MAPDIVQADGPLFPTVPGVASTGGVAMNAPPAESIGEISDMITNAMASVPDGQRGQLVGIATKAPDGTINVNLALAVRVGHGVEIAAWMGKSWGEPVAAGVIGKWAF